MRAVLLDGGAMLELEDVAPARRLREAYRDLLAAIGETLLDRVEPLGLMVEVLSLSDDPTNAATILEHLRGDAQALVDLLSPPRTSQVERAVPPPSGVVDQPTVLLVHPADGLIDALTIGLSQAGLGVVPARDFHEALEIIETIEPDAMVLHSWPSGLTVADAYSKLRAVTEAPMVVLDAGDLGLAEAVGGSARDVVLRRPLRFAELLTAIQKTLAAPATSPHPPGADVLAVGDVVLDERAHAVQVRGEPVEMPIKEFELLRVLLAHAGQAVSRERVIELIWAADFATGRRTLHTHVKRLRHRIERDPANPEHIVTIRGLGYRFNLPTRRASAS